MATDDRLNSMLEEYSRLRRLEDEYRVTLRVLAVVTEQLLATTSSEHLVLTDESLVDTPDLVAWRDESNKQVIVTVAR